MTGAPDKVFVTGHEPLATVVDLLPDEVEFLKFHGISNREYAKHLIAKRKSRDDALMEKLYGDMKEQGKRND